MTKGICTYGAGVASSVTTFKISFV